MKPIAIYGAGSLGREVLVIIKQINEFAPEWEIVGFFDDGNQMGSEINGFKILGDIQTLNEYKPAIHIILAVGNPAIRKRIVRKLVNPLVTFATIIHPSVQLRPYQDCNIGEGCIIAGGNILTTGISLGKHVILNMACTVGHNASIGSYTSVMPNCIISGDSQIGEGCFIGAGAAIMNRVEISPNSRVSARETVNFGSLKIME